MLFRVPKLSKFIILLFILIVFLFVLSSCTSTNTHKSVFCQTPGEDFYQPLSIFKPSMDLDSFELLPNNHGKHYSIKSCTNYPNLLLSTHDIYRVIKSSYFSSRVVSKKLYGFNVYTYDNLCEEEISVIFHRGSFHKSEFLEPFYLNHQVLTDQTISALVELIENKCFALPERIRVSGTINDREVRPRYVGVYRTPYGMKEVYGGTIFAKGLDKPELFDDNPKERQLYMDAELARIQWEDKIYRVKRQNRENLLNNLYTVVAAATVGYIQGVAYEFADEGVCHFLTFLSDEEENDIPTQDYEQCHIYLNNLYDEIKSEAPIAYGISNILGMMKTDLSNSLGKSSTRIGEATKRGSTACLEAILAEVGKLRLNEKLDERIVSESCAFGASLEGGAGFIRGADIKGRN